MKRLKKTIFFLLLFNYQFIFSQKSSVSWGDIASVDTISNEKLRLDKSLIYKRLKEKEGSIKDSAYAKILHIIGKSYWHLHIYEDGLNYTNKSILINLQNNKNTNKKHLSLSYFNLAGIQNDLQLYEKSLKNFNNSIILFEKLKFRKDLLARSYLMKSTIYFLIADYENSLQNAEKSIFLSNDFILIKLDALSTKSQALIELKKTEDAERIINSTIFLAEKSFSNSTRLANLYFLKGNLFEQKKDFNQAQYFYNKSQIIFERNEDYLSSANVLITIGDYFLFTKRYDLALKKYYKSINLSSNNQIYILRALDKIGIIYKLKKQFIPSFETYQKAFSQYLNLELTKNVLINPSPNTISGIADNDVLLSLIQHKAETWLAYYHHTHKKEYLQNALETFAVADKMVDYMRREHVGYQSKLFWRDKTHSLYENAIEVCYLLKNYEKGFYFFEKSRAVLLNDKINNLSANQLLSELDQIIERKYQREIADLNSKIESETVEAKKSVLNVKMLDIQDAQQKFIKNLAAKYPSYYQFKYDTSMYNLGQLRQYLRKSNTSFFEYFKGDSANYQLVIKPTGMSIIKQKDTENPYQYLINAVDLGKRVIVSQDGEFVPLDTLKNTKGEILLNKYAFSNTYSAQYLLRNAEKKVTNGWLSNFIGFAPVNYSKSMALPSLLGADEALGSVSGNYFWPKNFEKERATKANFAKNASDYKIIQLFTHADADNVNKEPTIFFADSAMKVSELESFGQFNTELLVLSACKTNVGKVAKGEGTLSMAREFAGLGIPATITTLWSVENEATYQITELFYKYLKNGEPKDIALQKAKLEYLEINSREKQNPKYWAGFVLMGETAPLAGFDGRIVYFGLLFLAVIFAISIFYFKRNRLIVK